MPGGEKTSKKINKKKPSGLKKEPDISNKVSLKVKIHQPEIRKKIENKSKIAAKAPKKKLINKKIAAKKEYIHQIQESELKSKPDLEKTETAIKKNIASQPEDENKIFRQKQTVMWSGIAFFMILIIFVWTYNLKKTFQAIESKNNDQSIDVDLDKIGDEVSAKMKEMKDNLAEIRAYGDQIISTAATSSSEMATSTGPDALSRQYNQLPEDKNTAASTSSSAVADISRQELDELKAKLKDLENKINEKK